MNLGLCLYYKNKWMRGIERETLLIPQLKVRLINSYFIRHQRIHKEKRYWESGLIIFIASKSLFTSYSENSFY